MNMNKKIYFIIITLISFCLFNKNVLADSCGNYSKEEDCVKVGVCRWKNNSCISSDSCRNYTTEKQCTRDGVCKWEGGTCLNTFIADKPCDQSDIRKVLKFFGYLLLIARVAIPLIIIGFATFDLFKSVVDKDEKSFGKQLKMIMMRLIAGIVVFFIPNIVRAIFGISDSLNIIDGDQYKACASCLLSPTNETECSVD